jgi:hypothetical protein
VIQKLLYRLTKRNLVFVLWHCRYLYARQVVGQWIERQVFLLMHFNPFIYFHLSKAFSYTLILDIFGFVVLAVAIQLLELHRLQLSSISHEYL